MKRESLLVYRCSFFTAIKMKGNGLIVLSHFVDHTLRDFTPPCHCILLFFYFQPHLLEPESDSPPLVIGAVFALVLGRTPASFYSPAESLGV